MSDHGHGQPADESGKDRMYLSLFVIVVGLTVAMGATLASSTPPQRGRPSAGKRGVVVLKPRAPHEPAQVLYGTVVARGPALRVLTDEGERMLPRARVRHFETETDRLPASYFERYPREAYALRGVQAPRSRRSATSAAQAASPAGEGGCVVLTSGEVVVGRLTVDAQGVTVRWPYGERTFTGSVRVPQDEVRWVQTGVLAPTDDYWRRFPAAPIDARYARGTAPRGTDRLQAEAELAHTRGDWAQATAKWAALYADRGYERSHLQNLQTCARRWFEQSRSPRALEQHVQGLLLALAPALDRPEVARLAANSLFDAIQITSATGHDDSARAYAEQLRGLGGAYAQQAEELLAELAGRGEAEQPVPSHEGHGHEGHGHD